MKECLVIIDVQKGFLTKDTEYIPDRIRNLVNNRSFDYIVATKFINTKNTPHYVFTHWDKMLDADSQSLAGTVETLAERVFEKSTNSCFSEEFIAFINEKKISKLVLVGIDTDCCVLKTAFDCFDRMIPFEVITNCCASSAGKELHDSACRIMRRNFGNSCIH